MELSERRKLERPHRRYMDIVKKAVRRDNVTDVDTKDSRCEFGEMDLLLRLQTRTRTNFNSRIVLFNITTLSSPHFKFLSKKKRYYQKI